MYDDNSLDIFQITTKSIESTKKLLQKKTIGFTMLLGGCEGNQLSPSMVGETWSHVSQSWAFCLWDFRGCWFPNRDWKDLFLG